MINHMPTDPAPRRALSDDAWGADTRRILARIDDAPALDDADYDDALARALAMPTD